MQESMYKYMKVGLVHYMAYPKAIKGEGPILETLERVAEDDFFTAVEISWVKDEKIRDRVKELLAASHLTVAYCAQPRLLIKGLDLNSFNEGKRAEAVAEVKAGVDEAYEIGAKGLAFLSGKDPGEAKREKATELLVDSIKKICSYAKSEETFQISLEIFDREIDKKCLIGPSREAKRVGEEVRREYDNFGLMVDLSHLPLLGESPKEAILPVKDYLIHAHIGNCVLKDKNHSVYGDQHPRFGLPTGENDVEELIDFLRVLLEVGFLNKENPPIVSFEVKPLSGESSEVVIASAKRVLREAWAKL